VAPDTGNLLDDLTGLLRSFAKILETTPLPRVLILAAESLHDPELSKLFLPMAAPRREPLIAILRRAMARDELPADLDVEAAADVVVGPIDARVSKGIAVRPRDIRAFVEAAIHGIHRRVGAGDLADRLRRGSSIDAIIVCMFFESCRSVPLEPSRAQMSCQSSIEPGSGR
jgi:hypothetical protein